MPAGVVSLSDDVRVGRSVIAVDWSGAVDDRGENLWLAHCVDGELVELRNGWRRAAVVERIITLAGAYPGSIVGLDFSFAFPRWFAEERGWLTHLDMWRDVRSLGEGWLRDCPLPFWGRPGRKRGDEEQFRETEREIAARWAVRPKSTFQIGGAGAVGTGSVRGMPHLLTLEEAGCAIWPFAVESATASLATVVEMYPRLLTGPVVKRRREARDLMLAAMAETAAAGASATHRRLMDVAATSEDAFDAAMSAIHMHAYVSGSAGPGVPMPGNVTIEGRVWEPR